MQQRNDISNNKRPTGILRIGEINYYLFDFVFLLLLQLYENLSLANLSQFKENNYYLNNIRNRN